MRLSLPDTSRTSRDGEQGSARGGGGAGGGARRSRFSRCASFTSRSPRRMPTAEEAEKLAQLRKVRRELVNSKHVLKRATQRTLHAEIAALTEQVSPHRPLSLFSPRGTPRLDFRRLSERLMTPRRAGDTPRPVAAPNVIFSPRGKTRHTAALPEGTRLSGRL